MTAGLTFAGVGGRREESSEAGRVDLDAGRAEMAELCGLERWIWHSGASGISGTF